LRGSFGGKRDLFLRALSARTSEAIAAVSEALGGDDATRPEQIRAQMLKLAIALSGDEPHDLLVTKATLELADRDSAVADVAMQVFNGQMDVYRHCIIDVQDSGEIDPTADASALAAYFVAVSRGMEVLANAGVSRTQRVRRVSDCTSAVDFRHRRHPGIELQPFATAHPGARKSLSDEREVHHVRHGPGRPVPVPSMSAVM
jgi:AcrR family transcriptional regulator